MNKIVISLVVLFAISLGSVAQAQNNQVVNKQQKQDYQTYGYCLSGIELTADVQAKVTKMQAQHQAEMTPLRTKMRSTRDWEIKSQVRAEMDNMRTKHQEEIWALVPEAKNNALNLRLGKGRGQGNPGLGLGKGRGQGNPGLGQGRGGGFGRGFGRGAARGGGSRWQKS